jgi:hypothetical protein
MAPAKITGHGSHEGCRGAGHPRAAARPPRTSVRNHPRTRSLIGLTCCSEDRIVEGEAWGTWRPGVSSARSLASVTAGSTRRGRRHRALVAGVARRDGSCAVVGDAGQGGPYFVSALVEERMAPLPTLFVPGSREPKAVGVDLGLASLVTLDDGTATKGCGSTGWSRPHSPGTEDAAGDPGAGTGGVSAGRTGGPTCCGPMGRRPSCLWSPRKTGRMQFGRAAGGRPWAVKQEALREVKSAMLCPVESFREVHRGPGADRSGERRVPS